MWSFIVVSLKKCIRYHTPGMRNIILEYSFCLFRLHVCLCVNFFLPKISQDPLSQDPLGLLLGMTSCTV